jgi:endonuclease YncB( thermonuclease family)
MDASMNNGAWRPSRHLIFTLVGALISLPMTARADSVEQFVGHYRQAYVQGREVVPAPQTFLDTSSIATRLDLKSVSPEAALSGSAFLAAGGTVIRFVGVQGCLSTEPTEYAGAIATCAMISLARMAAIFDETKTSAGKAFPCHELERSTGRPPVRFAECFFMGEGADQSLSEALIRKGVAFASRDISGRPVFPGYALAEEAARNAKAGIRACAHFVHPYGVRYRANPAMH